MKNRINYDSQSFEIGNYMNFPILDIDVDIKIEESKYYNSEDDFHFIKIEGKLEIPRYYDTTKFISKHFLKIHYSTMNCKSVMMIRR
jgi:hypothetical protein